MNVQGLFVARFLEAVAALKCACAVVVLDVSLERLASGVAFLTLVALVWSLPAMRAHVFVQQVLVAVGFIARRALERFILLVRPSMLRQSALIQEGFGTGVTLKRFDAKM